MILEEIRENKNDEKRRRIFIERDKSHSGRAFLLTSGLHSPLYVEKFNVLQHPEYTEKLCEMIATISEIRGADSHRAGNGGIILSQVTARLLKSFYFYGKRKRKNDTSPWLPCGTG